MPWNDCVSAGPSSQDPTALGTRMWGEPKLTVARSYRRSMAGTFVQPTSGTVQLRLMVLPAGMSAAAMTVVTNTTAKTGGTHGWYVVTDSNRMVLAVTADYTDAATTWGTTYTGYKLPFTGPLQTAYTGVYYAGLMIAATGMPNICSSSAVSSGLAVAAPTLTATAGTGLTTPPAVGSQLAALVPLTNAGWYITLQSS